jgi:hypothetical protein
MKAIRFWMLAAALALAGSGSAARQESAVDGGGRQPVLQRAEFGPYKPSPAARHVADWVVRSRDNAGQHFILIDKPRARVIVFEPRGRLLGTAPVLLGLARGDHTVPGIGDRKLSDIAPHERTTPAGRFVAERGRNAEGEDIIWVDYEAAVSMHRVRPLKPEERRLERLASISVADNRISFGCINVPVTFYNQVLDRIVGSDGAIVYVLPDVRTVQEVFQLGRGGAASR